MTPEETALPQAVAGAVRPELPAVAGAAVAEIIVEVPSYADAFSGDMGQAIGNAVELALGGFLELATASSGADAGTPIEPALAGAYELGRGEARSGRTMDALLAAYRVGARVSWRGVGRAAGEGRASGGAQGPLPRPGVALNHQLLPGRPARPHPDTGTN